MMQTQQSMKVKETKAERKERKAREKASKLSPQESIDKKYVVCLKYGEKYSSEYVNVLHSMVRRNLTLDYEFVCFTEDDKGLNKDIRIEELPFTASITGWWYKPFFFNPNLVLQGTILFLDLDLIIFKNIDYLFTYKPDQFCIIRDFNRSRIPKYDKFNSSVFRLNTGQHSHVYTEFIKNANSISKRFPGDQDWIRSAIKTGYEYWPEEWIQSYKWEMRGRPQMTHGPKGTRNFISPGTPMIKPDTSIAVFHGDPNPHNCIDPWCRDNWR